MVSTVRFKFQYFTTVYQKDVSWWKLRPVGEMRRSLHSAPKPVAVGSPSYTGAEGWSMAHARWGAPRYFAARPTELGWAACRG